MKSKPLLLALAALAACGTARAQEMKYNPSIYITPEAGFFNPDNRFGTKATGADFGLKIGKSLGPLLDVQLGGSYGRVHGENGREQQVLGNVGLVFYPTRGGDRPFGDTLSFADRLRPFMSVEIGAENNKVNRPNDAFSRTAPYAGASVGVQYAFSDQFAAQIAYKRTIGFQRSDAFGFRRDQNNYVNVGLTFFLDKTPTRAPRVAAAPPPPPPQPMAAPVAPPAPPQPRFQKQTLTATELFMFDKAVLRQPQTKLDEIASVMQAHPEISDVRITGYTDRLGSQAYNQSLSERRANAVKAYLQKKGIDGSRLKTLGKGEADPVVQCSEKNRAALIRCLEPNRRVEVEDIVVERRVP